MNVVFVNLNKLNYPVFLHWANYKHLTATFQERLHCDEGLLILHRLIFGAVSLKSALRYILKSLICMLF